MSTLKTLRTLTLAVAVYPVGGCSSDDRPDATTVIPDSGDDPFDAGIPPDLGFFDGGSADASESVDAGTLCTMNGTTMVEGVSVPLGDPSGRPENPNEDPSIVTCLGRPLVDTTPFQNNYCPVECIDTFGVALDANIVGALEVAVFPEQINGTPVDPTYDVDRGQDAQPSARLPVGFRIVASSPNTCDSGYQLELGFTDLGASPLLAKERYILRVRSTSVALDWPTTYHWNFVRRNDTVPISGRCGEDTLRTPDLQIPFPIVPPDLIRDSAALTSSVVGTDSFRDSRGMGHVVVETRDCDRNGTVMARATVGFAPAPAGAYYVGVNSRVSRAPTQTSARGSLVGVGFPGNTATSSVTGSAVVAVGLAVNGACTEAFAGDSIPIYPDGVTYFRSGREVTLVP